ncbi:MAG: type II secretion system F family protein [Alphaproteobacteria bacterium]|jgi:tight adherence protein B|nr:type II secretion system F family protein [Alphaproteobacteria bacterium]
MTQSFLLAILVTISITVFLYVLTLSLLFPMIRARRHLRERWEEYGSAVIERWERTSKKLEDRRMRSLQVESRLKAFLAHPYPSLKMIKHLFYRSGVFPNLKLHIICQACGILIGTDAIFLTFKFSLINSFILGSSISLLGHYFYLRIKESLWKKAFINIFPLSLDIITRGLKSGMTLGRGIAMVSEEVEEPVGGEFNYMASQLQIGITPDDSLAEAAARIGIDEFRFFSLALIIQREMGGSLADILGKLCEVIRERDRFRKKVWTLSSESRATALIVGALPLVIGVLVEFISPGYMKFFFTDPTGKILLWVCAGLSFTGGFVIMRMMKVEA